MAVMDRAWCTHLLRLEGGLVFILALAYGAPGEHPACWRNLTTSPSQFNASQHKHPNLLIGIGSHKSGSTFLHHALSMHPQIVPAKEKEVSTFRVKGFQPSNDSYYKYLDNWSEWMDKKNHPDGAVLMEYTPMYISEPVVPCHIKQMFPKAKFVVTLREPVSRALSAIGMVRRHCSRQKERYANIWPKCCEELFKPVVAKLQAALDTLKGYEEECINPDTPDPWWRCPIKDVSPLERGLYAAQIAWWFQFFDPSQFIFISTKALHDDPHTQVERVLRFAKVDSKWDRSLDISNLRDNVAHVTFVEQGMDEMEESLRTFYKVPDQLLSRLLSRNGHDFPSFSDDGQIFNSKKISLQQGAALCCYGFDYDTGHWLPQRRRQLTEFCKQQPIIVRNSSRYWKWFLVVLVLITVLLIYLWKSEKFMFNPTNRNRNQKRSD